MDYPGYNSFWSLAEEVVGFLLSSPPLTVDDLFARFGEDGGRNVWLDHRTLVPLSTSHIRKVLSEHLSGYVQEGATGWRLVGSRPPLSPIWKMFSYPWGSLGYRMGYGQDYWHKWANWYRGLAAQAQQRYREENPEPASWRHFYEMMSVDQRDHDALMAVIGKRKQAERDYIASEYELARRCEGQQRRDQALYHWSQVLCHGGGHQFPDAEASYERLRQESVAGR
jgi:hypothetical protein